MNLSPDTINVCLELISNAGLTAQVPDAVAKMTLLVAAREELIAALDARQPTIRAGQLMKPEDAPPA